MAYSACIYTVKTTRGPDRPCCSSGQAGHKQIMKLNKPKEKCGRRSISCKFIIIPKLHALAISVSIIAMYQQKCFWCTNIAFATVGVGMSICLSHSWTVSKPQSRSSWNLCQIIAQLILRYTSTNCIQLRYYPGQPPPYYLSPSVSPVSQPLTNTSHLHSLLFTITCIILSQQHRLQISPNNFNTCFDKRPSATKFVHRFTQSPSSFLGTWPNHLNLRIFLLE